MPSPTGKRDFSNFDGRQCFDFVIRSSPPETPRGKDIANSAERCLATLKQYLSSEEIRRAKEQIETASTFAVSRLPKKRGSHPILPNTIKNAPIYSAFSTYEFNSYKGVNSSDPFFIRDMTDIARQALFLHYLKKIKLTQGAIKGLTNFSIQASRDPK